MHPQAVVVTGAGTGIGYHLVRRLAKCRPKWVIVMTTRKPSQIAAFQQLQKEGFKNILHYAPLDIQHQDSREDFEQWLKRTLPAGINILINNAGFAFRIKAPDRVGTQADLCTKINFHGTVAMCDLLLPLIKDHGLILNVASFSGRTCLHRFVEPRKLAFMKDPSREKLDKEMEEFVKAAEINCLEGLFYHGTQCGAFAFSKLGVIVFSEILSKSIKPEHDITVISCCPGWCQTGTGGYDWNVPLTAEQGAENIAWIATNPNAKEFNGKFMHDRKVVDWREPIPYYGKGG